jgi:hypothetical protein
LTSRRARSRAWCLVLGVEWPLRCKRGESVCDVVAGCLGAGEVLGEAGPVWVVNESVGDARRERVPSGGGVIYGRCEYLRCSGSRSARRWRARALGSSVHALPRLITWLMKVEGATPNWTAVALARAGQVVGAGRR